MKMRASLTLLILLTLNANSQWNQQTPFSSNTLTSIFFCDSLHGWISALNETMFITTNGGGTWISISDSSLHEIRSIYFLNQTDGWIVTSAGKILKTTDGGFNWIVTFSANIYFNKISFIDPQNGWVVGESNGPVASEILKTTDGGLNWEYVIIPNLAVAIDIAVLTNNLVYVGGGFPAKIFKTTDAGTSWTLCNSPEFWTFSWCNKIVFSDSMNGIIGCDGSIFSYRTNDGGLNWKRIPIYTQSIQSIIYRKDKIWFLATGSWQSYLIHSYDNGVTWLSQFMGADQNSQLFFVDDKNGWTISQLYLYKTTNGGYDSLIYPRTPKLESPPNNFICQDRYVQFRWTLLFGSLYHLQVSEDSLFDNIVGLNWLFFEEMFSTNLSPQKVYYWRVRGENPLGFSDWSEVRRFQTGATIGSIADKRSNIFDFNLQQNFPNPFNSSTTITFSLATTSFTTLRIFDILGKEVATLVNEELPPGQYSKSWDTNNLTSGVYFYSLQTRGYRQTRKIVLEK